MEVQIERYRLGLGVNLYSAEQTLLEQYGAEYLEVEFLKDSKLYRQKLLYGNEKGAIFPECNIYRWYKMRYNNLTIKLERMSNYGYSLFACIKIRRGKELSL